ncbi:MAG: cupin domain-containing protein [Bacteroidales bacterium]
MKKELLINKRVLFFFAFVLILSLGFALNNNRENEEFVHTASDEGDKGKSPWVLDIEEATVSNTNYRNAQWTGEYMQMVLMSLKPGEIIDLEVHKGHDQFIRIEQGDARILMGKTENELSFDEKISDDWAAFIPAGYWHTVENTGKTDLKLYTIYSPSEHPAGTVRKTYEDARNNH